MNMTMLPTSAAERETFLAELRCKRLEALLIVYHLDAIGTAVQHQMVTTEGGRTMLNEMLEPTSEGAET